MALIELKTDPSPKELRLFGLLLLAFFALVAGIVYWRSESQLAASALVGAGALLCVVYYAVPPWRRWIYLGWIYAAYPIGWCVSTLLLALVYYLVLTPVGLLMRLFRYDPMQKKREPDRPSYWQERAARRSAASYFRQY